MEGEERRGKLIGILEKSKEPVSGSDLAKKLKVSRQVIVQDIALLRATNKNILSTNKGYVLYQDGTGKHRRTFHVSHDDSRMEDELNTIVDNNGRILDVVVDHEIYGQITVDLIINSRRDVREFIEKITKSDRAKPLKELTGNDHYHTVEADSEKDLDIIEEELTKKGYIIQ